MPELRPELDLVLNRTTHVSTDRVWKAWTTPELLKQWFTPKPWRTADCVMDLRPGGRFWTLMESPDGDQFSGEGCILEAVPERRLVWTSALGADFRPNPTGTESMLFTAFIEMEPEGTGTRYKVTLLHAEADGKTKHEAMGFESGWGAAFDQLVDLMSREG